jgi:hypothetical protein
MRTRRGFFFAEMCCCLRRCRLRGEVRVVEERRREPPSPFVPSCGLALIAAVPDSGGVPFCFPYCSPWRPLYSLKCTKRNLQRNMNRNFRQQKAVGTTDRQEERRRGGYGRSSTAYHFLFAQVAQPRGLRFPDLTIAAIPSGLVDRRRVLVAVVVENAAGPRHKFDNGLRTFISKTLATKDPQ